MEIGIELIEVHLIQNNGEFGNQVLHTYVVSIVSCSPLIICCLASTTDFIFTSF